MQVNVLLSPYDSGHYGLRMGSGPLHFQANGLEAMLAAAGHDVHLRVIEPDMTFPAEVKTAFELHRLVADAVRGSPHAFSLLLAGNCNTSLGAIAGLGQPELGLIWFDAHGE